MIEDNLIREMLEQGDDMSKEKCVWGVRVSETISYKDLIVVANSAEVIEGALVFKDVKGSVLFCVASGDWYVYYVSNDKGKPDCVKVWAMVERDRDYE
jgi:hypothetical protein